MTAALSPRPSTTTVAAESQDWAEDLGRHLPPSCFPARQDELLATLLRHRAPSHLLWRLTCLPRTRRFSSLGEVLDHVQHHATAGTAPDPF